MPQYNSAWINYLRNGYNYDEYQRSRNNRASVINGVLSGIRAAASFVPSAISGVSGIKSLWKYYKGIAKIQDIEGISEEDVTDYLSYN